MICLSSGRFRGTRIVRDERYKYVFNGFDFDELYDLGEDPHEMWNRTDDPKYAGVKRDLIRELWKWVDWTDDVIVSSYPNVALVPYGPMESSRIAGKVGIAIR